MWESCPVDEGGRPLHSMKRVAGVWFCIRCGDTRTALEAAEAGKLDANGMATNG